MDAPSPFRVLFVSANRLGDAILSTGLLDHLLRAHAGARVTVACGPVAAPLFASMPGLERTIILEKRPFAGHWFALWRAAAGRRWDLVVDLRASALAWLLCARERRVFDTRNSDAPVHRVAQLAAVLGLREPPAPRVWISEADHAEAAATLPLGRPILAIGPTANWGGKQWPAARFVELVTRLTSAGGVLDGAAVAVLGAADERAAASPVLAGVPADRRIDLVGTRSLGVLAACLQRADLYVGNDSGLMHLAAAAGAPTLGLFGPSREVHYAPWGPRGLAVRTRASYEEIVGAAGYDYRRQETHMESLDVDAVARAAVDLWQRCHGNVPA
jgi:heptosyltransferase-3